MDSKATDLARSSSVSEFEETGEFDLHATHLDDTEDVEQDFLSSNNVISPTYITDGINLVPSTSGEEIVGTCSTEEDPSAVSSSEVYQPDNKVTNTESYPFEQDKEYGELIMRQVTRDLPSYMKGCENALLISKMH